MQEVKDQFGLPVISDVHSHEQAGPAGEVLDIIQIPAYLCMQTTLTLEVAKTGKPVNVKKAQFLAPEDMKNVIGKIERQGNENIIFNRERRGFWVSQPRGGYAQPQNHALFGLPGNVLIRPIPFAFTDARPVIPVAERRNIFFP